MEGRLQGSTPASNCPAGATFSQPGLRKCVVPYARNARTHSEAQIAQIAGSIREFGFTNPVLIDPEGGIIAGHGPNAPAWPAAAPASAAEPAAPPSPVTALPPAAKLSRRLAAAAEPGGLDELRPGQGG